MTEAQKKVLIFEDNSSIQTLLKFYFQRQGIETRFESDGTGAVDLAKEFRPDLILMDYIMPGKDGIETIADLRQAGIASPIVMLSSKNFPADLERARAAGATDYLLKPINPKQLEAALKPYLT